MFSQCDRFIRRSLSVANPKVNKKMKIGFGTEIVIDASHVSFQPTDLELRFELNKTNKTKSKWCVIFSLHVHTHIRTETPPFSIKNRANEKCSGS